jgi:hypothetical protein
MKKYFLVALMILSVLLIVSCLPQQTSEQQEIDLIKELKEIERQLQVTENLSEKNSTLEILDNVNNQTKEVNNVIDINTDKLQRIEFDETDLVSLDVETEDLDGDRISYTFSSPLAEDGTWRTDYGDAGEYIITITASDGQETTEQKVLLVVRKKNVPPEMSNVPANIEVNEGETVRIQPEVVDPNKDEITITFTAPLDSDGTWITDHTSAGEYEIIVTASDGEAQTKNKVILVVKDRNVPPTIEDLTTQITVREGEIIKLTPKVTDLDGDKIELSISEPVGDDGVWQTGFNDHGRYTITVTASDGKDTTSKEVKINVQDVNVPPKIIAVRQG